MKLLIVLFTFLTLLSCQKEELVNPIVEIQYGSHERNVMDYNYVSSTCYLFIHGGGWVQGDKSDWYSIYQMINSHGYSYAAMNYRFVNETDYIGIQEDVDKAVNFLRSQGIKNIILVGGSAGSHIALLYATNHNIQQVITIGTIATTTQYLTSFLNPHVKHYGNVSVLDSSFNCDLLAVHGELDTVTYIQQSIELQKKGAKLLRIPNGGHVLNEFELYQLFNSIL